MKLPGSLMHSNLSFIEKDRIIAVCPRQLTIGRAAVGLKIRVKYLMVGVVGIFIEFICVHNF